MTPHMEQLSAAAQAWIRSTVPAVVAAAITWLIARGVLGPDAATDLGPPAVLVLTLVAIAAWQWLVRWLEPRVPSWVTTLMGLMGTPPSYVDIKAVQHPQRG